MKMFSFSVISSALLFDIWHPHFWIRISYLSIFSSDKLSKPSEDKIYFKDNAKFIQNPRSIGKVFFSSFLLKIDVPSLNPKWFLSSELDDVIKVLGCNFIYTKMNSVIFFLLHPDKFFSKENLINKPVNA